MVQKERSGQDTLGICLEMVSGVERWGSQACPRAPGQRAGGSVPRRAARSREQGESQPALGPPGAVRGRAGMNRDQTGTQDNRHQLRPDGLGGGGGQELVCWPELPDRLGALTRGGDAGQPTLVGGGLDVSLGLELRHPACPGGGFE